LILLTFKVKDDGIKVFDLDFVVPEEVYGVIVFGFATICVFY